MKNRIGDVSNLLKQMLDSTTINIVKEISIRGRLAYGASCLEHAIQHFGIMDDSINEVLSQIWEFTSSKDLGEWDQSMSKVDPACILNENKPSDPLLLLYQALPSDIIDMISDVIEIGAGNLYGGTSDHSPYSLEPLIRVIERCVTLKLRLPELDSFKKSPFSEEHGWGLERDKCFFAGI